MFTYINVWVQMFKSGKQCLEAKLSSTLYFLNKYNQCLTMLENNTSIENLPFNLFTEYLFTLLVLYFPESGSKIALTCELNLFCWCACLLGKIISCAVELQLENVVKLQLVMLVSLSGFHQMHVPFLKFWPFAEHCKPANIFSLFLYPAKGMITLMKR